MLLSALLALAPIATARAAPTFVVDSLVDAAAGAGTDLTDGVCETAIGNGVCTLRAAIMEANEVIGGGATIRLPAGVYFLTIPPNLLELDELHPEHGDLDLLAPMTLVGDGPGVSTIDGNQLDRVLRNEADGVTVRDLTIRGGRRLGEIEAGGGILNNGNLTLDDVLLFDNDAGRGAGITSLSAELTLRHCVLRDNEATGGGGGILIVGGSARIVDSWIHENHTDNVGGGIASSGEVRIERTLISENSAEEQGGGIFNFGQLLLLNSTVWKNLAVKGGGGVFGGFGGAQLLHTTVTDNLQTDPLGPVLGAGLAVDPENAGSIVLRSSVVADNLAEREGGAYVPSECGSPGASIVSGDYNLIGSRASCFLTGALGHVNPADVAVGLPDPAPNGGFAPDQAGFGPTRNGIPRASCTDELGALLAEDQRGYPRTGDCDFGAHESGAVRAPDVLLGVELLRNGGALGNEIGPATDGTEVSFPSFWRRPDVQNMTQIAYGAPDGYPLASEAPLGSGFQFFGGGFESQTFMLQEIDVTPLATRIDAGEITYRVAGAFGGFLTDGDAAELALYFLSESQTVGNVIIGGFTAADRSNLTGLLPDSAEGTLPPGTRSLEVIVQATRANGASNDGYSDALSLLLPEPSSGGLGALAAAALLGLRAARSDEHSAGSCRGEFAAGRAGRRGR
jgi:CSLREA domain-containing protein